MKYLLSAISIDMGLILYLIAFILELPIYIVNFVTVLIMDINKRSWFKTINDYFFFFSLSKDKFGNYNYRRSLNLYLTSIKIVYPNNIGISKIMPYKFGNPNETISSALGKNQIQKALSIFGWIVVCLLWIIDVKYWFKGGHCINSINDSIIKQSYKNNGLLSIVKTIINKIKETKKLQIFKNELQ